MPTEFHDAFYVSPLADLVRGLVIKQNSRVMFWVIRYSKLTYCTQIQRRVINIFWGGQKYTQLHY